MGKKLETILKTFKHSTDANILLGLAIAISYFTDWDALAILPGLLALKQYAWGHFAYARTRSYIKRYLDRGEEVNEEAITRLIPPCDYCGSRYAIREFRKSQLI